MIIDGWLVSRIDGWLSAINDPAMCQTHNRVIAALGGKARMAEALSLNANVLTKWHERGIPARYWGEVCEICATLDPPFPVTVAELKASKPGVARESCPA
jgi:hypothetical protein